MAIKLKMGKDKRPEAGCLENVTLAHVYINKADKKFGTEEPIYQATAFVDEETADEYKSMFPKASVTMLTNKKFAEKYPGLALPQPEAAVQYAIKLRTNAVLQKDVTTKEGVLPEGSNVPYEWEDRPKVYLPQDGVAVDVTATTNVGHGSKGNVSFGIKHSAMYGSNPKLRSVLVTDLVEAKTHQREDILGMPIARSTAPVSQPAGGHVQPRGMNASVERNSVDEAPYATDVAMQRGQTPVMQPVDEYPYVETPVTTPEPVDITPADDTSWDAF